jgi:hypothetical protein
MNDIKDKLRSLIRRYEKRLEEKNLQVKSRPNDCVEGIIVALEQVIEDLKEAAK